MLRTVARIQIVSSLSMLASVWIGGAGAAYGQFMQNRATVRLDASAYPAALQKGLRLFEIKCNMCHGLELSLKTNISSGRWSAEVKRMRAMASSRINNAQAKVIADFLNYDEDHRKPPITAAGANAGSDAVSAGRELYYAQSCDACHSIGGKGGQGGPAMDGIGAARSRDQLLRRLQDRRAGAAMPPLPSDTTDQQINQIVDFLLTLKGQ